MASCPNSYLLQVPTIHKSGNVLLSILLLIFPIYIPLVSFWKWMSLFLLVIGGDQVGYLTPTLRSRSPCSGCGDTRRSKSTSRSFLQLPRTNQTGRCLSPSSPNNTNDRSFLTPAVNQSCVLSPNIIQSIISSSIHGCSFWLIFLRFSTRFFHYSLEIVGLFFKLILKFFQVASEVAFLLPLFSQY